MKRWNRLIGETDRSTKKELFKESHDATVDKALIPDMDYFKGSEGGRALSMLHPDGSPNLAPGFLEALADALGEALVPDEIVAYVAGPEVIGYTVGGRNVLNSWFNYRKKEPSGKRTSPLDDIHVESWPTEWTAELVELLTVLTRLVELEPAQADLLDRIVSGPLATRDELATLGMKWPKTRRDRAPRRAGFDAGTPQQPSLSGSH